MKTRTSLRSSRGFSLIEVMVAVIVISVGLLGIAKMQALSMTNTQTARIRALASIEAASLAATMHANRAYWAQNPSPALLVTVISTSITAADGGITGGANCAYPATCTPIQMAASDLKSWQTALTAVLPNYVATISCPNPLPTAPLTCTINLQWTEKAVAMNSQEATAAATTTPTAANLAALQSPSYLLEVQP